MPKKIIEVVTEKELFENIDINELSSELIVLMDKYNLTPQQRLGFVAITAESLRNFYRQHGLEFAMTVD
jgi:hypothetical protein